MKLTLFLTLPLRRSFISLDLASGVLYRHEVRQDPMTGLCLTAKFNIDPKETPK